MAASCASENASAQAFRYGTISHATPGGRGMPCSGRAIGTARA
jgi:hypothetical protein